MERFTGLIGIFVILGIAFALSNNRKAINYRTVLVGLSLQFGLAVFILKTDTGQHLFGAIGIWSGSCSTKPTKAPSLSLVPW